jgi:hypothetical protein
MPSLTSPSAAPRALRPAQRIYDKPGLWTVRSINACGKRLYYVSRVIGFDDLRRDFLTERYADVNGLRPPSESHAYVLALCKEANEAEAAFQAMFVQ